MKKGNPLSNAKPDLSLGRDDKGESPDNTKTRFQQSLRWQKGNPSASAEPDLSLGRDDKVGKWSATVPNEILPLKPLR